MFTNLSNGMKTALQVIFVLISHRRRNRPPTLPWGHADLLRQPPRLF
jgi:hypothetical protein